MGGQDSPYFLSHVHFQCIIHIAMAFNNALRYSTVIAFESYLVTLGTL